MYNNEWTIIPDQVFFFHFHQDVIYGIEIPNYVGNFHVSERWWVINNPEVDIALYLVATRPSVNPCRGVIIYFLIITFIRLV